MKKVLVVLFVACMAAMTTSCHTVHGFGQDLEKVGGKIADKAEKK